jgi:hypothetical protein
MQGRILPVGHSLLKGLALLVIFKLVAGVGAFHEACAAQSSESSNFDYPELSVVPRASDRLRTLAEKEPQNKWGPYLPIQISALTTLTAGVLSLDSASPGQGYAGIAVGGGWLIGTTLMAMYYHPYTSSHAEMATAAKGSVRDQLANERAAEEGLKAAARVGQKLRWISLATNLGTSIFILQRLGDNNPNTRILGGSESTSSKTAQTAAIVSIVASVLPIIFKPYWIEVWNEQEDYKKRIYAPVAQPTFFQEPGTQKIIPGFALSMKF